MAASLIDLRQQLVSASERRLGSQRALADVFGVRHSCVEQVLRRDRTPGELGPKPHGGGQNPQVDAAARALLRQVVHDHPDATLEELCAGLVDTTGVRVSLATMCRVVQRLALPRQKNRAMRRSATRPASSRRGRTTASCWLGWLGTHGLQAVMTVESATDAEVFRTSVKRVWGPTWRPGDIVVMDHRRAQKAVGVPQALARRGARRRYVPPSSPELSPIEPCGSKVKTVLRKAKARTRQALDNAMTHAIATVTRIDAQSWLMPCGDALR